MVALNFNARNVAPNTTPEPLPTGVYDVVIVKSEELPTKNRDGFFTALTMKVQGGEFNGRTIVDRLNLKNKNPQAVEIAYGTLSAICYVTGRLEIQQTEQLHGIPFKVSVSKVPRDDRPGAFSNEVVGYKDINGNDPGQNNGGGAMGGQQAPNWAGQQQMPDPNAGQQNFGGQPQFDPNGGQQMQNGQYYGGQPQGNPNGGWDPNAGQQHQQMNNGQAPQGNPYQGQPQGNYQGQQQFDPNAGQMQGQGQQNFGGNQGQAHQDFNGGGQGYGNPQQNFGGSPQGQPQGQGSYPAQQQNPNAQGGPAASGGAPDWVRQ